MSRMSRMSLMEHRLFNTQARQTRSNISQEKLPTTIASPGAELPPNRTKPSSAIHHLVRDVQTTKRNFDASNEADLLTPKRARTDAQQPGIAKENPEQVGKTTLARLLHHLTDNLVQSTLQQPKPKPLDPSFASSLEFEVERPEEVPPASDSDDNKPQLRRLTRKNLALFDRTMKSRENTKTSRSTPAEDTVESLTTKTTSTTMAAFASLANKNGILFGMDSRPPTNIDSIRERVAERTAASPTESDYRRYVNVVESAINEATMIHKVNTRVLKEYDDENYHQVFNQAFTGFPKEVGFNNGLSVPKPDFIEGLSMREYQPFPIDEHVDGAVLYKETHKSLVLPHLAGEYKGFGKDLGTARVQSAYDGAALVYARNEALSYLGKADPPGHAQVITFTTDGTTLNLYAHYAAPSGHGSIQYYQYPIMYINLLESREQYSNGRRALRKAQDYAREQSYLLRDQLKEHWERSRSIYPITEDVPLPDATFKTYAGDTSYNIVPLPCQPTPTESFWKPLPFPSTADGGSHKRKASLSSEFFNGASKHNKSYGMRDGSSKHFLHRHSDGRVSCLDKVEDDDDDDDDDGY
ncbi:hypothetical protein N0V90_013535 [Kalmusia sp. IMI 367209]|nr:hypothetical protein N0V90_013535 [Kalmusia sp. IMI 367209]